MNTRLWNGAPGSRAQRPSHRLEASARSPEGAHARRTDIRVNLGDTPINGYKFYVLMGALYRIPFA